MAGSSLLRRSRACRMMATASRAVSVVWNRSRSVVAIFPSPATRSRSQSVIPIQYARPTPRDDGEALLGEHARGLHRLLVVRVVDERARRAEDRYRVVHVRERVEPFDELSHDAEHPPGVGPRERAALTGELREESFVL